MSLQTINPSVQKALRFVLLAATLLLAFYSTRVGAEDGMERKVKTKVAAVYPEIARKMGLSGSVKLELVIAPNGTVKETKVIGGHPILVNAAVDAVKKWKFETGAADSTGTVEFRFEPGS
ncbi:MAG TPA: energy transducer TonB [Terriglobales bacterium]|nr:energy transducer TonB [Terriglobales bacterium]